MPAKKISSGGLVQPIQALKHLYLPKPGVIEIVDVPAMNFLMIDGRGDPNNSVEFQSAMEALYGICYTMKFMHPKGHPVRELKVLPPEGLWWINGGEFDMAHKQNWAWTLMIMQPDPVTRELVTSASEKLRAKKNPPGLHQVRFERFHEGLSVQALHLGPYADEPATIAEMRKLATGQGYSFHGRHHEIYLSDPRRGKPERMKTVLRLPVRRA